MIGFFEEVEGVKSMGRLISFILVIAGLLTVVIGILTKFEQTPAVAAALIGTGAVEKLVSKFAERKNAN